MVVVMIYWHRYRPMYNILYRVGHLSFNEVLRYFCSFLFFLSFYYYAWCFYRIKWNWNEIKWTYVRVKQKRKKNITELDLRRCSTNKIYERQGDYHGNCMERNTHTKKKCRFYIHISRQMGKFKSWREEKAKDLQCVCVWYVCVSLCFNIELT